MVHGESSDPIAEEAGPQGEEEETLLESQDEDMQADLERSSKRSPQGTRIDAFLDQSIEPAEAESPTASSQEAKADALMTSASRDSMNSLNSNPSSVSTESSWAIEHAACRAPTEPTILQPATMLPKLFWFWTVFCQFFFSQMVMDARQMDDLRQASTVGTVVYVVEGHTWIHHLLLNYFIIKNSLPLAGGAYGLCIAPYVSWLWPFWAIVRFCLEYGIPREELEKIRRQEAMQLLRKGQPIVLPVGYGMSKEEGGLAAAEVVVDLIKTQRSIGRPLCLCPIHIVWNRAPLREETRKGLRGWITKCFGSRRRPGVLRTLASVLTDSRDYVQVSGTMPINLSEWLLGYRAGAVPSAHSPDDTLAKELVALFQRRFTSLWRQTTGPPFVCRKALMRRILNSQRVKEAVTAKAESTKRREYAIRREASRTLDRMATDYRFWAIKVMRFVLKGILSTVFQAVFLDENGQQSLQRAIAEKGCPVVYIPTQRSYFDYLLLSFILFTRDMVVPNIAAGSNLGGIWGVGWIFRRCGAFFVKKSFTGDPVYKEVFREYVTELLEEGHHLGFFIEGGRSRHGKIAQPRLGLMGIAVDAVINGKVQDVLLSPISIQYDRVVEGNQQHKKILGSSNPKTFLKTLLVSWHNMRLNFGNVVIKFAEPLSVRDLLAQQSARQAGIDKTGLVVALGHRVVWSINQNTIIVPSCLVATVLLTHSHRGLTMTELVESVQWLTTEILNRGAIVAPMEETARACGNTIKRFSRFLHYVVPNKTMEPLLNCKGNSKLDLAYYRNHCLHLFVEEALIICAIMSSPGGSKGRAHWIRHSQLLQEYKFLAEVLKMEFVYRPGSINDNFESALGRLTTRGTVSMLYDDGYGERVQLLSTPQAKRLVGMLRSMVVPFIDAYWVAALSLLPLQSRAKTGVMLSGHLERMQKIAQTMYYENKIHSLESESADTLCNAISTFEFAGLITRTPMNGREILIRAVVPSEGVLPRSKEGYLFSSLVDAIKKLDGKRRNVVTDQSLHLGPKIV